jgi:hypothetical protein
MSARSIAERAASGEHAPEFDLGPGLRLEAKITASEGQGIEARWEYGCWLLGQRVGKQLPAGLIEQLVAATGTSARELQYRMRFAEHYPTADEVRTAVHTSPSWREIRAGLTVKPANPKRRRVPAKPEPWWKTLTEFERRHIRPRIEHPGSVGPGLHRPDYHHDELVEARQALVPLGRALDELIAIAEQHEAEWAPVEPEGDPEDVARAEALAARSGRS